MSKKAKAPEVAAPDVETKAPEVAAPDVETKAPEVAAPDVETKAPEVAAPEVETKAPEVAAPEALSLDAAALRTALDVIADGGPLAQIWARLEAEHGAQVKACDLGPSHGIVSILGIEAKPTATFEEGLRLWGNKARRALLGLA